MAKQMVGFTILAIATFVLWPPISRATDLVIPIPKSSRLTPVQGLNREGVEALKKNQFEKAKDAFFKAYLIDPNDPFTLNNLGYVSELEGDAVRAQRFYSLAAQQSNGATVGLASTKQLEGQSFQNAVSGVRSAAVQINRANFEALHLFSENRAVEADVLLQKALQLDPHNPFTLNNLGVAKEMEGDYQAAFREYSAAAASNPKETALVTSQKASAGRPVGVLAAENARRLSSRLKNSQTAEAQAALLNFRGVTAVNQNEPTEAAQDFLRAYQADPSDAFSLNNAGYVAEMDGDLETAQSFYESARRAPEASKTVGLATSTSAEGQKLFAVADGSDGAVAARMEQEREAKQRENTPIRLMRRDGQPVTPGVQPTPIPPNPPPAVPQ